MVFYLRYIFYRRDTTIKPFAKSDQLITNGIYRISRNPIYIGMVVFLVGTAILFGSATPWIVRPFYPWLINRKFILIEEEMLEKEFGEEYRKYKSRVRRWI
jgi:protein-S-isoprenylcysteine O-methyltransferase Ste14